MIIYTPHSDEQNIFYSTK